MRNYYNFRSTYDSRLFHGNLILFRRKSFLKETFFPSRCTAEYTFREGIKFQRSRTYVPDKKGRLPCSARARNSDKSIRQYRWGRRMGGRKGEENFCDRAIILSASLKDRTNRNTGRLWRCTCIRVCSLRVCSNPSLLPVKIELVILMASDVHFGISEEKYRDERPTIKLLSSTSIVRTSSLPSYEIVRLKGR